MCFPSWVGLAIKIIGNIGAHAECLQYVTHPVTYRQIFVCVCVFSILVGLAIKIIGNIGAQSVEA